MSSGSTLAGSKAKPGPDARVVLRKDQPPSAVDLNPAGDQATPQFRVVGDMDVPLTVWCLRFRLLQLQHPQASLFDRKRSDRGSRGLAPTPQTPRQFQFRSRASLRSTPLART